MDQAKQTFEPTTLPAIEDPGTFVFEIPPKVMKALFAVRESAPTLLRKFYNDEGGWDYVSIDQYYEEISPLIAREGLNVQVDLTDSRVILIDKVEVMEAIVSVSLEHRSGIVVANYRRFPIQHEYQGGTTCGSMVSYAKKVAIRSICDIATGESDSDGLAPTKQKGKWLATRHQPNTVSASKATAWAGAPPDRGDRHGEGSATVYRAQAVLPELDPSSRASRARTTPQEPLEGILAFELRIGTEIGKAADVDALDSLYRRNKSGFLRVQTDDPKTYDRLVQRLGERKRKMIAALATRETVAPEPEPEDGSGPARAPVRLTVVGGTEAHAVVKASARSRRKSAAPPAPPTTERVVLRPAQATPVQPATTRTDNPKPPPPPWKVQRISRPCETKGFPRQPRRK